MRRRARKVGTHIFWSSFTCSASLFSARLVTERPGGLETRIERGLELVLCRPPTNDEIDEMLELHAELLELEELSDRQAFEALCVLMLNLNEFLHVG